ncbi:MAG: aldo/keto reductase [Pseudomonadota bacterium]
MIPRIGLGTWPLQGDEAHRVVAEAIGLGYTHVDTAQMYGNEAAVGQGIRASGQDVFVTTKVHHDRFADGTARESAERSRDALGRIDLLLVHWPPRGLPLARVIEEMAEIRAAGLCRLIGVSNFNRPQLRAAAAMTEIATNQVEYHLLIDQSPLKAVADELGIPLTAYQPIAKGRVFDLPAVRLAAARHGRTPAEVAIAWILAQNVIAIPKSARRENLAANLAAADLTLAPEEVVTLTALTHGHRRFVDPADWAPDWDAA